MTKVFFKNLDALRFFAFLAVFFVHSFYTPYSEISANSIYRFFQGITRSGYLGVNFFFVLSGFLITYLLLHEELKNGTISVKSFYVRRVLRIWPLYFLIVFIGFTLYPLVRAKFGDNPVPETSNPWLFISFLSNFDNIYNHTQTPTLYILWSVAIEEQFYLFWPLLFVLFSIKKKWIPLVAVLLINILSRFFFINEPKHLGANTLCVIGDMAVGGLLAWSVFTKQKIYYHLHAISKFGIIAVYVLGILLCLSVSMWNQNYFLRVFERLILSLFFAFVIFEQSFYKSPVLPIGKFKFFNQLGKVSYGLYCYHYLCLLVAIKLGFAVGWNATVFGVLVLDNLVGLIITIIIASLSYKYFEAPFLKLKEHFQPEQSKEMAVEQARVIQ